MSDIIRSVDASITQIEINRPARANALRRSTIRQMEAALDSAEGRDPTRDTGASPAGVLLTGGRERFSAGADLSELDGTIDDLEFDDALEGLCRRLTLGPLPVVAAVEGPCYGAAVDLAWSCDAVVVSTEARLALPSTSLGILYNPVSVARLHSRLGSPTVRRLMVLQQELSGRELPPGTAMVVPAGTTTETARSLLRVLSFNSGATAATKALLASLDSGEEFDPAVWQPEREALLATPTRRAALEARRAAFSKDQSECS
ncbi:MAG: enoyl-CoA hydratase/isomerase family protein [Acidimicrobiaceae bacterium]|nr:enoyl-CoA hydratase/isomerase family protein [Acidimicrobiaceae bacterium]MCY3642827.1 enoyl-CoA hydratase/isomerase family protein [Acidimicrobiaceae bacterium]